MNKGDTNTLILIIVLAVVVAVIAGNIQQGGEINLPEVTGGFSSCSDSDNGINIYTKGTCTSFGRSYSDICQSTRQVREYYCSYGYCRYTTRYCPTGYSCVNGACTLSGTTSPTTAPPTTTTLTPSTIPCTRNPPKVAVKPASYTGVPGSGFKADVTVTNMDSSTCGSSRFYLNAFAQSAMGTATATTPVIYSTAATPKPVYYYIYSDLGNLDNWARIIVKDETNNTVEIKVINQGDFWDFPSISGLRVWVTKVYALEDGTIVGTVLFAFNSSWKTNFWQGNIIDLSPDSSATRTVEIISPPEQPSGDYKIDFSAYRYTYPNLGVASAVYTVSKYACVWACTDRGYTTGRCASSCLNYERDIGVDGCISGQKCCCFYV